MKYKEGDVVIVKSLKWYKLNRDSDGYIREGQHCFNPAMRIYCGKPARIISSFNGYYMLDIALDSWVFQDYMLDDLKTLRKHKLLKLKKYEDIRTKLI